MAKFRKQINNLVVVDSSPRLWREVQFQVRTKERPYRILEEFDGGEEGKQKAIDCAKGITDFLT